MRNIHTEIQKITQKAHIKIRKDPSICWAIKWEAFEKYRSKVITITGRIEVAISSYLNELTKGDHTVFVPGEREEE